MPCFGSGQLIHLSVMVAGAESTWRRSRSTTTGQLVPLAGFVQRRWNVPASAAKPCAAGSARIAARDSVAADTFRAAMRQKVVNIINILASKLAVPDE